MNLGRVGSALRGMDDAYATKIQDLAALIAGDNPGIARQIPSTIINDIGTPIAEIATPGTRYITAPMRYALPAAGVTAAGAGLMELTQRLGQPEQAEQLVLLSQ